MYIYNSQAPRIPKACFYKELVLGVWKGSDMVIICAYAQMSEEEAKKHIVISPVVEFLLHIRL